MKKTSGPEQGRIEKTLRKRSRFTPEQAERIGSSIGERFFGKDTPETAGVWAEVQEALEAVVASTAVDHPDYAELMAWVERSKSRRERPSAPIGDRPPGVGWFWWRQDDCDVWRALEVRRDPVKGELYVRTDDDHEYQGAGETSERAWHGHWWLEPITPPSAQTNGEEGHKP